MAGKLWIVNYLEPFPLEKQVDRILSDTRPPGSNRLVTALVEASDPQAGRLKQHEGVVSLRPVSEPIQSTRCVAVNGKGHRCRKPASVIDPLWAGLVCEEHASDEERLRHNESARILLDSVEQLKQQMAELLNGVNAARAQSDTVSVLATELLLGLHTHLAAARDALDMTRTALANGIREMEEVG